MPVAFPPRDRAKPAPECVWEELPGQEHVTIGAAWEILFSKKQQKQESWCSRPRLQPCAKAWITSIGFLGGYARGERLQTRHSATFCMLLIFLGLLGAHSANWRPSCRQSCWQTLHLQGRFSLHKMSAMLNLCCQVLLHSKTVPFMTAFF